MNLEDFQEKALASVARKAVTFGQLAPVIEGLGRLTRETVAAETAPLLARIESLERQLAALRGREQ